MEHNSSEKKQFVGSAAAAKLSEWAPLVLPYLPSSTLASASLVCKTLHLISSAITTRRSSDATRGLENQSVPFVNKYDAQPYVYFLYTPFSLLYLSPSFPQPWGGEVPVGDILPSISASLPLIASASGCACQGSCETKNSRGTGAVACLCSWLRPDFLGSEQDVEVMTECGPSCACGEDCGNRSTQRGVSKGLAIIRDERKGWGLHAAQLIKKSEFVCEYAGEFLTTEEARRRQKVYDNITNHMKLSPALLVVREHLPSGKACFRINIDATKVGNVARFINHSCDGGNLLSILVRNSGSLLPRLCFFAARDIPKGEEITFSYGDVKPRPNGLPCFCKSSECLGFLPSEET